MSHIILLILKILGFLILVLAGLMLVAVITVLFAPAGYRFDLTAEEFGKSILGKLRFYWIKPFISGEICYDNGNLTWNIRAAWKKFGNAEIQGNDKDKKNIRNETDSSKRKDPEREKDQEKEKNFSKPDDTKGGEGSDTKVLPESNTIDTKSIREIQTDEKNTGFEREADEVKKIPKNRKSSSKSFGEKIKYTFRKLCDNIKTLIKKKEVLEQFLKNEIHKNAFSKLIKETKQFAIKLRPRKAAIKAKFGFEDPSVTGYILALISIIYPFLEGQTEIIPDFEHKVFEMDLHIEGKIRLLYLFLFAFHMLMDKNVRITVTHLKKLKL